MNLDRPLLPGGLPFAGSLRRDFAFRPIDGRLELQLADVLDAAESTPEAVSGALMASLASLCGAAPERAAVDALCVADRQFLMRHLASLLTRHSGWFEAACSHCSARFDFPLDPLALPAKPAGEGFPVARVRIGQRQVRLRVPSGGDQIRVVGLPEAGRREALLRGLELIEAGTASGLPGRLGPEQMARCEAALEAVAPELACQVLAECPDCGGQNRVEVDPYRVLAHDPDQTLQDVHRLAWYYHWAEAEILAMPRARRARYLQLIDAARGMSQ